MRIKRLKILEKIFKVSYVIDRESNFGGWFESESIFKVSFVIDRESNFGGWFVFAKFQMTVA